MKFYNQEICILFLPLVYQTNRCYYRSKQRNKVWHKSVQLIYDDYYLLRDYT